MGTFFLGRLFITYALLISDMANCGRCGKPIYKPGEAVCDSCRRTISRDASRHANRMNKYKDQEKDLFMNLAFPGKDEEDLKEDMRHQHYVDTYDASAVWVDDENVKNKKQRRR
jgi:predicted amidophosphoribosyltransferase